MSYHGPTIDVDIHHSWKTAADVIAYLPRFWREHLTAGVGPDLSLTPGRRRVLQVDGKFRLDALPEDGSLPGTDYETLRRHLDRFDVEHGFITYDVGVQSGMPNVGLQVALCRAANEFTAERWLPRDPRLHGMILVPTADPEAAAREIAHWSGNDRMVGVLLVVNSLGRPFGHPVYEPVFRAAVEHGRPVTIHIVGTPEGRDGAGGNPLLMLEQFPLYNQPGMHYLSSMITSGLFERHRELRVMMIEWGFSWVPSLVGKLEAVFPALRRECPAIRRRPSDVVREHVRFSTQPFDFVSTRTLSAVLGALEGMEDLLCFASDYPHWDGDDANHVAGRLPKAWHRKVFYDNAASFFGLAPAARAPEPAQQAAR